ncbi:MAG TPA: GDP-mannose 4,6-dehydratase, partial [archaeon]|nr:GDP-mannose 4,6-dehydratase [archaeon]
KAIPLFTTNLIEGKKVPLYGDGKNVRDWLHVEDNCKGILLAGIKGKSGEIYNIGSGNELQNIELTKKILELMGEGGEMIERVEDRKGHDRRYSLDSSKIKSLGWKEEKPFEQGLKETVEWYKKNEAWWKPLKGKNK